MNRHRLLGIVFVVAVMFSSSGCTNRFMAGVRKLFVKPATASAKYTVAGVKKVFHGTPSHDAQSANGGGPGAPVEEAAPEVRPVVAIDDGAGKMEGGEEGAKGEEGDRSSPSSGAGTRASSPSSSSVITPAEAARYREELVTKPYDAVVRYNIGRLYLQQGLLEEATYELDMATSLDPKFTYAFILLGRALRMRGMYDLAMAKFTAASTLEPDLPLTYIDAGVCWDQRGYHDRAREAYMKALALQPQDGRIYNNIGYSFFLEGDYGQAIKSYRSALSLSPDDPQTNNNMAIAYAMQQRWDKALHHFTEALGEAAAQNNIGHLLLRAGKVDQALAHLELAVRLNPESVRAMGNLESALRLKGRVDDAAKLHARLVEVEKAQTNGRMTAGATTQQP